MIRPSNKVFIIILLLTAVVSLKGESHKSRNLNISRTGFYTGLKRKSTEDMKTLRLGLFYNHEITSVLGMQTEIHYVKKGAVIKGSDGKRTVFKATRLSYIEIPLMLKLTLPVKRVHLHILAGGYAAYCIKGSMVPSEEYNEFEISIAEEYGLSTKLRRLDYGLTLGLGLSIDLKYTTLHLEARYNHGLRSIYEEPALYDKRYNRTLSFMIGMGF